MVTPDDDFHDFVVGFAGPLTSLAYLLIARPATDATPDAQRLSLAALAYTRRRWRDVHITGAPEPIAVEALLARLPRHGRAAGAEPVPNPPELATIPSVAAIPSVATIPSGSAPVTAVAASIPQHDSHAAFRRPAGDSSGDEQFDGVDLHVVREAIWRAWLTLEPRHRVPLVFADPSVASRRLAGLGVPESFASSRRLETLTSQGIAHLHVMLSRDPSVPKQFEADDEELCGLLADALQSHAQDAFAPTDSFKVVSTEATRMQRRLGIAVVGVVAALAATAIAIASVSTSRDRHEVQAAAASASVAAAQARLGAAPEPAQPADLVVNWPTRGDLRNDAPLLASVRTAFVAAHPDTTGEVQILLATNTPFFRVVFAAAQSRAGVVQSWFYGPVGASSLTEGNFGYGPGLTARSVIAEVLADTQGHAVLVVIAPPDATDVRLIDSELEEVTPGQHVSEVSHPDGIAIRDESGVFVPTLLLQVQEGGRLAWNGQVGTVQLAGSASIETAPPSPAGAPAGSDAAGQSSSASAGSTRSVAAGSIPVQRGTVDPGLLAAARFVEQEWQHTGEFSGGGSPSVLWGGNDSAGTKIVVMRVRTLHLADLIVVAWTDRPTDEGEYLLAPDAPDYPLGFAYSGLDSPRIGVLVPNGVTSVDLVVDGVAQPRQAVAATGFASLRVSGQYGTLADQTFVVEMFDAAGHQLGTTSVPPEV